MSIFKLPVSEFVKRAMDKRDKRYKLFPSPYPTYNTNRVVQKTDNRISNVIKAQGGTKVEQDSSLLQTNPLLDGDLQNFTKFNFMQSFNQPKKKDPIKYDPIDESKGSSDIEQELQDVLEGDTSLRHLPLSMARIQNLMSPEQRKKADEIIVRLTDIPYKFGGKSETAVDCSGLISLIAKELGVEGLEGNANSQYQATSRINQDQLNFGDLVFLKGTQGDKKGPEEASHVGFVMGKPINGVVEVFDASSSRGKSGRRYYDLNKGYFKDNLLGFGRIKYN